MKISLVAMRAPARLMQPSSVGHTPVLPALPTELVARLETPCRPVGVSALTWEMLAIHVDDAERRSSIAYAQLRLVVQAVVRELRATDVTWESIYAILQSVVSPATGLPAQFDAEYEMHASRSAALVAHMHSWADVERLAELATDDAAG